MRPLIGSLGCIALVLAQTACGLLDTSRPDIIEPGSLDNPNGATTLYFGAVANFNLAKDGDGDVNVGTGTEGQVILSGLLSDEFVLSTTPPSQQEVDQRAMSFETNSSLFSLFGQLHKAREGAEKGITALQRFSVDSTDDPRIPELWSLAGYTYLYFGENFCDGVAYSTTQGSKIIPDTSHTRLETLKFAAARFDSALTSPALPIETEYLARIGLARVLLNISRDSAAAAAALVAGVPTSWEFNTEHGVSPAVLQNAVFNFSQSKFISVSDAEGGVGLAYRGDRVRVPSDSTLDSLGNVLPGLDLTTPQFFLLKYDGVSASIPLASGLEARLIEAEARLRAGAFAAMTGILNTLRAGTALSSLSVPGTQAAAEDQLFSERAFWLYATGHRHGDMRRLVRQYGRPVDTVFPNGTYLAKGVYGTNVNLPIPFEAANNPRFVRSMCDPDAP